MIDKWDKRFLDLAAHISSWSKDPSTQVGAVLVSPDRTQIIVGYNGFPRGVPDFPDQYADKEKKYAQVVHAELNAILNCPTRPEGWTLYITPIPPCNECTKAIIQSGIKNIICRAKEDLNPKWLESWTVSSKMLSCAGVNVEIIEDERTGNAQQGGEGFTSIARSCC